MIKKNNQYKLKHQHTDFKGTKYELGDLFFYSPSSSMGFSVNFITGSTPCYLNTGYWTRSIPENTIKVPYVTKDSLAWVFVEQVFLDPQFHKFCSDNNIVKKRLFEI